VNLRRVALVVLGTMTTVSAGATGAGATTAPPSGIHAPSFTDVPYLEVVVDGRAVPLGASGLTYRRRTAAAYDDPATPEHDALSGTTRRFLACAADEWSMGNQIFTVDPIAVGNARGDATLVERGARGLDWGVQQRLRADGVHTLERSCDGATVADYGGAHHSTQWLAALGEAVYLLQSSPFAEQYRARTDVYVTRMEKLADRLVDDDNARTWERTWLVDDEGHIFTHKTYMRAAGLGLAASLTDDPVDATRWASAAARIAHRGMAAQRANGVNPERGGYDVAYQMYGTWLALLYDATLEPGPLQRDLRGMIDRAIAWMSTRIDDRSGQVDIGSSSRVCNRDDGREPYEAADAVRVLLTWSVVSDRPDLADQAVLIDRGARSVGNPCPRTG
jgi:hypothetical protein